jgi:hypothetical protein
MGMIVDLFAGGGGASQGIFDALGRHPDAALDIFPPSGMIAYRCFTSPTSGHANPKALAFLLPVHKGNSVRHVPGVADMSKAVFRPKAASSSRRLCEHPAFLRFAECQFTKPTRCLMSYSPSFPLFPDESAVSRPEPTLGGALRLVGVQLYSLRQYVADLAVDTLTRGELFTLQAYIDCALEVALDQLNGVSRTLADDAAAKPLPRRERPSEHVQIRDALDCLYRAYDKMSDLCENRKEGNRHE